MAFINRPSINDSILLEAIKSGKDEKVLSVLYKEVLPKVKQFILKNSGNNEEVKDIFQDAIIIFYRYVKAGKFKEEYEIAGFIVGVCKNLYLKQYNKTKKEGKIELSHEYSLNEDDELQRIITKEKEDTIHSLMNQLGERCKELLTLSVFDKRSMKEISSILGFANEDAAKTGNYKCKQRLMKMISGNPTLLEQLRK